LMMSEEGVVGASGSNPGTSTATPLNASHLARADREDPAPGTWFSCVAFAVGANKQIYTNYVIPTPLFDFAHEAYNATPSIPCGVLYFCGLVRLNDCAPWTPLTSDDERVQVPHALASPRWAVETIAKHMLVWPQEYFAVDYPTRTTDIAELILHRVLNFPAEAEDVGKMLNRWHRLFENGLGPDDVQYIISHKITFAHAAHLLCTLGKHTHSRNARTPWQLEECLKIWDDVLIY